MILVINTIERHIIELGLADKKTRLVSTNDSEPRRIGSFKYETQDQSADILPAIEGVLKNHKIELKDITAIAVNQGPGSFTGVRVGIAVANTLAWSLDIPVVGYREGQLESAIAKTLPNKFSKIVLPSYPSK